MRLKKKVCSVVIFLLMKTMSGESQSLMVEHGDEYMQIMVSGAFSNYTAGGGIGIGVTGKHVLGALSATQVEKIRTYMTTAGVLLHRGNENTPLSVAAIGSAGFGDNYWAPSVGLEFYFKAGDSNISFYPLLYLNYTWLSLMQFKDNVYVKNDKYFTGTIGWVTMFKINSSSAVSLDIGYSISEINYGQIGLSYYFTRNPPRGSKQKKYTYQFTDYQDANPEPDYLKIILTEDRVLTGKLLDNEIADLVISRQDTLFIIDKRCLISIYNDSSNVTSEILSQNEFPRYKYRKYSKVFEIE